MLHLATGSCGHVLRRMAKIGCPGLGLSLAVNRQRDAHTFSHSHNQAENARSLWACIPESVPLHARSQPQLMRWEGLPASTWTLSSSIRKLTEAGVQPASSHGGSSPGGGPQREHHLHPGRQHPRLGSRDLCQQLQHGRSLRLCRPAGRWGLICKSWLASHRTMVCPAFTCWDV